MQDDSDLFDDAPSFPLYHYTSIGSLVGIAESKSLWASSPYYLNDSAEVLYAAQVLDKLVRNRISEGKETEISMRVLLELIEVIRYMRFPNHNVFTFSLSARDSLLSQWRSYTQHGKGVSIGFSPELIKEIALMSHTKIARCLYHEHEQIALLNRLIDKVVASTSPQIEEIKSVAGKMPNPVWHFLGNFHFDILQVLCVVKHPSFEEEQEWRLIGVDALGYAGQGVRFRETASMLVPFIELPLPPKAPIFSEVVLGPSQHSDLSITALAALLSKSGLCNSVRNCLIPYREW